ncbi:5-formyltetrahydrofolate cyclo-ligase [Citroniella saccharovorans]|uniref:5-formyltetrahydrofolate cyclo-ligase n=1 Tax=Citroniella saccharovorans TaxID=2053367 RepID=A0AAW9MX75_9FIRM|nr:5-formyltetrahydrofolate cyclo-ligase [Citroniella saccharovorans]MEB3429112.1 5-formyltetrahydrofolate cyclo-ligase [Citroniella saccharovorans]
MDKKSLRKSFKEIRNNISDEERKIWDKKAFDNLISLDEYKNSKNIFAFINFGSEIDTKALLERFFSDGKNVFIPITEKNNNMMKLTRIKSLDGLEPGHYGILSPKEEDYDFVDPDLIDFVLVPGLCFDKEGYRVGYGGGYYDRFFSSLKNSPIKVGFCYKNQLVEKIDHDEFDLPVDFIITN